MSFSRFWAFFCLASPITPHTTDHGNIFSTLKKTHKPKKKLPACSLRHFLFFFPLSLLDWAAAAAAAAHHLRLKARFALCLWRGDCAFKA
jgi:hypothetical protein